MRTLSLDRLLGDRRAGRTADADRRHPDRDRPRPDVNGHSPGDGRLRLPVDQGPRRDARERRCDLTRGGGARRLAPTRSPSRRSRRRFASRCSSPTTIRSRGPWCGCCSSAKATRSSKRRTARRRSNWPCSTYPSLIVMDLNMPTMDGYEAIAQIRRVQGLESTPIVVVTMEDSAKVGRSGARARRRRLHHETVRAIGADGARQGGVQAAASGCVIASARIHPRGIHV